jgi:small subunit ribosomal protein S20
MPVIKSAKKKLRQDKKRTRANEKTEDLFKKLIKQAKKSPTEKNVKMAISVVDKAAKKNIIHKNKAARIKSSLSKLGKTKKQPEVKKTSAPSKKKTKNK